MVIDDSSFPVPAPLPAFSTLVNGDVYRSGAAYRIKANASQGFDLASSATVSQIATDPVQKVSALLTISAPV